MAENREQQNVSIAARINELETRVTSMSMDIARMTMKVMTYEAAFADFLKCQTVDEVQDRIYKLQFVASKCDILHSYEELLSYVAGHQKTAVSFKTSTVWSSYIFYLLI